MTRPVTGLETDWPAVARTGEYVARDFAFADGAHLDTRLAYHTLGEPRRDARGHVTNAALLLHGTTGTSAQFLHPSTAEPLFGPGAPLDVGEWFIVMPDGIGAGGSSKPSDGLRTAFPRYGYRDQVEAQRQLLDALGVRHLRLVLGTSMGGMQSWLWAGLHPDYMDAVVPIACEPAPVSGRNMLWRELMLEAIRTDPDWRGGDYDRVTSPTQWARVWPLFRIITENATTLQHVAPTRADARGVIAEAVREGEGRDACDTLYALDSSRDYDPAPLLPGIDAAVIAINFADDFLNPPELGVTARAMTRVRRGRSVLVPASSATAGHQTLGRAAVWAAYVADATAASRA